MATVIIYSNVNSERRNLGLLILKKCLSNLRLIRIRGLRVEATILLNVGEGVVHEAAVAAVVAERRRAVHQLLLRQRHQRARGAPMLALETARGGEGPTTAAHALILHVGDVAVIAPVHRVRHADVVRRQEARRVAPRQRIGVDATIAVELCVLLPWL